MDFLNETLIYIAFVSLIILGIILSYSLKFKRRLISIFGEFELIKKFSENIDFSRYKKKFLILSIVIFLLFLSLARPQWGTKIHKIESQGLNIFFILDVSKSMLAQDIVPNRLERAKYEISKLLDELKGDRIGIIIFSGSAFIQVPLTVDYGACKMMLDMIDTDSVPTPGTDIGAAIRMAIKGFAGIDKKYRVAIILTDGEDHIGRAIEMAEEAKKEGIIIYTIGIGTPAGELIPIRDENNRIIGYKKDKNGNPVLSKLDEITLKKIALITSGKYYSATAGELELKKVYNDILKMERERVLGKQFTQKEDRFQFFLLPAVILLIYELLIRERNEKLNIKELIPKINLKIWRKKL